MINNDISYQSTCSSELVRYLSIRSGRGCIACLHVRRHTNCVKFNYSKCDVIVSFLVGDIVNYSKCDVIASFLEGGLKMFRDPVFLWLNKMSAIVLATL